MITGIKDLDRKILEYINKNDYLALLLTNKYINSLFDNIFFQKKLKKEFDFTRKSDCKRYYIIVHLFHKVQNLVKEDKDVEFFIDNKYSFKSRGLMINHYTEILYSENNDEILLWISKWGDPFVFTTSKEHKYKFFEISMNSSVTEYVVLNVSLNQNNLYRTHQFMINTH